jgi:hypothetical protein
VPVTDGVRYPRRNGASTLYLSEVESLRVPDRTPIKPAVIDQDLQAELLRRMTANTFNAVLAGEWDNSLDELFTTAPHWASVTREPSELKVAGQTVRLPGLMSAATLQLNQDQVNNIRTAYETGTAVGRHVKFRMRPGDRVRVLLEDVFPPDRPIDFTEWEIPGIQLFGIHLD